MTIDDPFEPQQDPERTVLVPTPGGKRPVQPGVAPPGPIPENRSSISMGLDVRLHGMGLNSLVKIANPLLDLAVPLRRMVMHSDVEGLRRQLVQAIRTFETQAKTLNTSLDAIAASRYALCTLLDEAISHTPWGGGGVWAGRSLLITFHNEGSGGEKFFLILQRLAQEPAANVDVLELMYVCLSLGLEGRYSLIEGGKGQLDQLRERLLQLISANRKPVERELSPHWQGAIADLKPLFSFFPVWVLGAVLGAVLVLLHLGLSLSLNHKSDPVFAALNGIHVAVPVTRPAREVPLMTGLTTFLAPEIQQGLVSVSESPERDIITLRGDGLFSSGSADLSADHLPLLNRIGSALRTVTGNVLVAGYTDNQPIYSLRFPSNWHLSKARAEAVQQYLEKVTGMKGRFTAEGKGDTDPLVPNDTPANRARNRRVDVTVFNPEVVK